MDAPAEPAPEEPGADRYRWSTRERLAFLGILLLLAAVARLHLAEREEAARVAATGEVLDEVMRRIQGDARDQRHRTTPPGGIELVVISDLADGWGRTLRVDPTKQIVYSLGADGLDQAGEGDDLVRFFGRP